MPVVIGIAVRKIREVSDYYMGGLDLNPGDWCIIETENELESGFVVTPARMVETKKRYPRVLRKMAPNDYKRLKDNEKRAKEVLPKVVEKIEDHELDMKLTCIEYTFDRNKLFVYYTADERVDFRELIKNLGHILRVRIQMVQIGVRDEAKILGGCGPCGLPLCCDRFLKCFSPVSMEMAKEQDMTLNPTKISGICGRLMCCLAFEYEGYIKAKKKLPRIDSRVNTPRGVAKVKDVNVLTEKITVEYEDGTFLTWLSQDIAPYTLLNKLKFKK